jgi:hypothetical protein
MSDFRNSDPLHRDPNDPKGGNVGYEPANRRDTAGWGWIAGAVFLAILVAIAFGLGHEPNNRVASNDVTPPAAMHPLGAPMTSPGLAPPPAQSPAPTPNRP